MSIVVFGALLPMVAFSAVMLFWVHRQTREAAELGLVDVARAMSVALDRELGGTIAALRVLAASDHLAHRRLGEFHDLARAAVTTQLTWQNVVLYAPSGQVLVNTRLARGERPPSGAYLDPVQRAVRDRAPVVSDLFVGRLTNRLLVSVVVPVFGERAPDYALAAIVPAATLLGVLREPHLPSDWVATIVDRNGRIVARTRAMEEWLGKPATPAFLAGSRSGDSGSFRDVTRDGVPVYSAYSRSLVSGWTVGLGAPVAAVEPAWRTSLWALGGAAVACLLIAGGLAATFARRIAGAIRALSASAHALGRGEIPPEPGRSGIVEVQVVERELAAAAHRRAEAIAAQHQTEQALRDSEASFRLMFEHNPLPMWVYDIGTLSFLEVNAAAVTHYGYSRNEFLRMKLSDVRPADDVPRLEDAVAAFTADARHTVQLSDGAWRHRLKNGELRDVEIVAHAIDFAGRGAALVVVIDVTEQTRAREALAQSTERLSLLHEIEQAIIAAKAPVEIAEAALRRLRDLLGVPRAIVNLFDLKAGQVEWLAAAGRRRMYRGPRVRYSLQLAGDVAALQRGEPQVMDVRSLPPSPETEALLASGVHAYMVVPMIAGGELIGSVSFGGERAQFPEEQVSIAQEVATQLAIAIAQTRLHERIRRQAEELEQRVQERTRALSAANARLEAEIAERRRAQAEADRASRVKSQFLANMSHELRTPLNGIIGFAQLMHDGKVGPVSAEHQEYLGDVLTSARHLLALINDILDLAKVESGSLELRPEPVNPGDLIHEVLNVVGGLATRKRIQLESAVDPALGPLMLDPAKLKQVLYNYVSNAIKFTAEDGRVTLRVMADGADAVRFAVADTGIGIRAEDLPRLFVEFEQIDPGLAKRHEGTGLGLALTKRLVEAQGGRVGVHSTFGRGSVFFAVLPRVTATVTSSLSRDS